MADVGAVLAVAAVDLGATSGRVMLGRVGPNELRLEQAARFANDPVRVTEGGTTGLHWNVLELYRNVLAGLGAAAHEEPAITSIGVDSWAVDYALLRDGRMLGNPYHYRDERTAASIEPVHRLVPPDRLYRQNGLQFLPFNSLYQLAVDRDTGTLDAADTLLLIPDLIAYWLTGRTVAERSNASTTGLLTLPDGTKQAGWNLSLIEQLGLPPRVFPKLVDAGTHLGPLLPSVASELGIAASPTVTTVGSHDTASAVVAVPMQTGTSAYISCGTWGLVGVELEHPVLSEESRAANFTNEGGVDGRVRYLHNVMGLWLLSESVRTWQRTGLDASLPQLLAQAAAAPATAAVFDADDPRFLAPGDMPSRIRDWYAEHDLPSPQSPVEFVRAIIESLADAFAHSVRRAAQLSGQAVSSIHVVGGGSQNVLLCQLTADRSGLPVFAGPVEATALGNVLVQARAHGAVSGDLESLRALVAATFAPTRYDPRRR